MLAAGRVVVDGMKAAGEEQDCRTADPSQHGSSLYPAVDRRAAAWLTAPACAEVYEAIAVDSISLAIAATARRQGTSTGRPSRGRADHYDRSSRPAL